MRNIFRNLLIKVSKYGSIQFRLERHVKFIQYVLGIGSGSGVETSGEKILVHELKQLYNSTGKPLCIFDVGANQGQFLSLIEDGLQGIHFQIHAFEPGKLTYQLLADNTKKYSNTLPNNFGLGKKKGEFNLYYDELGSGLASLSKRRLSFLNVEFSKSEKVQIETLDDYCKKNDIQNIDQLKIDVEGHELDVLEGGLQMIRNKKVKMITFEFGGCNIDTRTYFQDFWYFFKENCHADFFRITPSGYLFPIQEYKERYEQFTTTNFFVALK